MIATAFHYWISPSLVNTQLNVDGIHNRVMINIDAKALLYVCIPDTVNKIKVTNAITKKDEEHFQSFKLRSLDVVIPDNNPRYVYAVVPKTSYTANEELDALPTPPQAYLTLLTGKVNIDGTSSGGVSTPSEYPTTSYHYIYLGGMIGASETNGTLHERYWQETLATGSLSQVADALPSQYWIKNGAINITLNALGEPDKISASVASNAVIMAYIPGYDTLGYDSAHNYRRWQLAAYPTAFGDAQQKYIYIAIPRAVSSGSAAADTAYLVFPSQRIGIDGKNQIGEQIGSTQYYYIWLRASISSSGKNGTTARYWLDEDGNKAVDANDTPYCPINFGSLSTDDSSTNGSESEWWQYNPVTKLVTFLKTIATAAFNYLFAKKADITTLNVTEETVTTQQVVDHTDWGQYTADASGATVRRDASGNWLIETDYLKVRKKATFTNVEIQDVYHVGGQMMLTSASCRVDLVDEVKDETGAVTGYRIYFKKTDSSGQRVDNTWKAGDQAYCNTFDLTNNREALNYSGTQSNHFVWRLVTALNNYPTIKTWSEVKNKAVTGAIKPYVDLATQVKQGTATLQKFIDEWNTLLEETKYIRDDAKTYLAASYLVDVNNAMTKVADSINAVLADDSELVLNYQFSSDLINNGIIAYASELDKLRRLYLTTVYHTLVLSNVRNDQTLGYAEGSDKPRVGDNFVQLGYRKQASESQDDDAVKNRQGALILAGAGANAPYIYMFKNIGRKWSEAKAKTELGETVWASKVAAGTSTAFLDGTYFVLPTPYMQFSPAKTVINSADVHLSTDTSDEDYDDDDPNSINSIFNSYSNRLDAVEEAVDDISDQTDGSFRIWQGENFKAGDDLEGQPIYPSHFPSNGNVIDGTKDEKDNYVIVSGWEDKNLAERVDDFYVATDGLVWQFKYDATTGYKWDAVADEYLVAFVNQIKEKKRVFLLKDANGNPITTDTDVALYFNGDGASAHPARNYEVGDLWVSAYYYLTSEGVVTEKSYDNDILVCVKDKAESFSISDWNKANNDVSAEIMNVIYGISVDNKIEADEKATLATKFNEIVSARASFYESDGTTPKYSSLNYTEYAKAYNNLCALMYAVFGITAWNTNVATSTKNNSVYNGTIMLAATPAGAAAVEGFTNLYLANGNYYITAIADDSDFNAIWWTFYQEYDTLSSAVLTYVLSVNEQQLQKISDIANDLVVDDAEMANIRVWDKEITTEHTNLEAYAFAIATNDMVKAADFSLTEYNAFATAFNDYQQAYFDYHAIIDVILNVLPHNAVFYDGTSTYNYDNMDWSTHSRLLIDYTGKYAVSDNNIGVDEYIDGVNPDSRYYLNVFSSTQVVENISQSKANYLTNVSFDGSSFKPAGNPNSYRWITRATFYNIITSYKAKATALQNKITKLSQLLVEENARAYTQSVIAASTADNILTANEKRAICQELNSIGADMQYAAEKAKAILGTLPYAADVMSTSSTFANPTTERPTNAHIANVYDTYIKMLRFFNILAGAYGTTGMATNGWLPSVTNGIAREIGITRAVNRDDENKLILGFSFTLNKNASGSIDSFDLSNFFYYAVVDIDNATGEKTGYSGENDIYGGTYADAYDRFKSYARWYVGRNGKTSYSIPSNTGGDPVVYDVTANTFLDAFNDYYAAANNFSNAVIAYNKYIADKAKETADKALKSVQDVVADGIISKKEKDEYLAATWNRMVGQYGAITFKTNQTTDETALINAYTALVKVMTPIIITYYDTSFFFSDFEGTKTDMLPVQSDPATVASGTSDMTRADFIALFNTYDTAYANYIKNLNNAFTAVANDNVIDTTEKSTVANYWNNIHADYEAIKGKFSNPITTEQKSIKDAYDAVTAIMTALGYDTDPQHVSTFKSYITNADKNFYLQGYDGSMDKNTVVPLCINGSTDANVTREDFNAAFSNYDTARTKYQDKNITDAGTTAGEANINATNAISATGAIANDGIISAGTEKQLIYQIYSQIKTTVSNYVNQCKSYGITYADGACTYAQNANDNVKALGAKLITYVTAYNTLDIYLTGHEEGQLNLFGYTSGSSVVGGFLKDTKLETTGTIGANSYTKPQDYFRGMFEYYYSEETKFANALEKFKKDQLASASIDMVGGSITIKADTNIAIDSSKIIIGKGASNNDESLDGCLSIDATTKKAKFNGVIEAEGGSFTGTVNASGGTITGKMDLQKNGFTMSLDPTGNRPSMKIINDTSKAGLEMSSFVSQVGTEIPCIMFSDGSQNKTYLSKDMLTLGTTAGNSDFVQLSPSGLSIVGPAGKIEINLFGESPIIQIYDNAKQTWTTLYQ